MGVYQGIAAGQGLKLVRRGDQVFAGQAGQFFGHRFGVALGGVQAGAHGRAAQGQLVQVGQGGLHMGRAVAELGHPARNFLPQRQRRGILQVGAANFDDVGKCGGFIRQRLAQQLQRGQQPLLQGDHGGHMHGGGEHVVA